MLMAALTGHKTVDRYVVWRIDETEIHQRAGANPVYEILVMRTAAAEAMGTAESDIAGPRQGNGFGGRAVLVLDQVRCGQVELEKVVYLGGVEARELEVKA